MKKRIGILIALGGVLMMAAGRLQPAAARVAAADKSSDPIPVSYVFTVDRTSDLSDRNRGDGVCDVSVNSGDQCTLRAAIEELNALGPGLNPHRILFNIPGSGVHTIAPATRLPIIDVPVHINGASQPEAACPTENAPAHLLIQLDGNNAGENTDGLILGRGSDGSTISGLVVTRFSLAGIVAIGIDQAIYCNLIGLAPDGVTPQGNRSGLSLLTHWGQIGHPTDVSRRNVISGNEIGGAFQYGSNNTFAGNYVGTTADGLSAVYNGLGIWSEGAGNRYENNIVSGNGTGILSFEAGSEFIGNLIGVAADGHSPLPNQGHGIHLDGGNEGTIGEAGSLPNHIAFNEGAGIKVEDYIEGGENNTIRFNAIHDNGGLGIDLGPDGVNPNDDGDGDEGPNRGQNFPVLSARPAGFVVDGTLNSAADTSYTIDAYRSASCDPEQHGEGEEYIYSMVVSTNGLGDAFFELDLRGELINGDYVTATATDPDGNTSEFSRCVRVGSRRGLTLTVNQDGDLSDDAAGDGVCDTLPNLTGNQCSLRAALQEINALGVVSDSYRIEFDIAAVDVATISPESPLPTIQVPVEIDGISQSGAACPVAGEPAQLKIVLDGSAIPTNTSGLVLDDGSSGSLVRGLVIGNFPAFGLRLNSGYNQVACSHIGIGADGVSPMPNGFSGIYVSGLSNQIGGLHSPNRANVISYNGNDGIFIRHTASFTMMGRNRIGTTADGQAPAGNEGSGITVGSDSNIVGGPLGSGNLISGNGRDGVTIYFANNVEVYGNLIGTGRDGTTPIPNAENGVAVLGTSSFNRIGTLFQAGPGPAGIEDRNSAVQTAGGGNQIAFNGGRGVLISENETAFGSGNSVRYNSIHDNVGLGIDLGADGVDVNDAGDIDEGVNGRQNAPVLSVQPGSHSLELVLESISNTTFEIDLYFSQECDPSGFGEGERWVRSVFLVTDADGRAEVTFDLSGHVTPGTALTATAIHQETASTSEFSNCVVMQPDEEPANRLFLPVIAK